MSTQKATKEKVKEAMAALRKNGEEPTINRIQSFVGGGCPHTVTNLRAEIQKEELAAQDSPELLTSFRFVYNTARQKGFASRQDEFDKLSSEVVSLTIERDAFTTRLREMRDKNEAAQTEIGVLKDDLTKALKDAAASSDKLVSSREELGAIKDRLHKADLELAAIKARRSSK
jgi:chromosome segregation ATPase